mgnify:CR=1 FL=1
MKTLTDRTFEVLDALAIRGIVLDDEDVFYLTIYSTSAVLCVNDSGRPKVEASLGFAPTDCGTAEIRWSRWYRPDCETWERDYIIEGLRIQIDYMPDQAPVVEAAPAPDVTPAEASVTLSDGTVLDDSPF